jgi:hypothetical protein
MQKIKNKIYKLSQLTDQSTDQVESDQSNKQAQY